MQKSDGMNYAPKGKPSPVVKPGEFIIAAVALDQNLLITLYSRSGHTTLFRQRDFREAEAAVHIRLRPTVVTKTVRCRVTKTVEGQEHIPIESR